MDPMLNRLLNRDFRLPADGMYHLVPMGEFKHGTGLVQVVDAAAVTSICNRFNQDAAAENFPGLLVDFDHFSDDATKPSTAAGWITALQNRADGVWGKIRWSDEGLAAVEGGRYRLASPVWLRGDCESLGNRRVRPMRLDKVALTNDPNMRGMAPLSNRDLRRGMEPAAGSEQKPKDKKSMKSVATKLGLSAEASEDAVLDAVTKLMNRAEQAEQELVPLKNRVTAMQKDNEALLAAQVESDLERLKNRIAPEKREPWRKALLANRAQALELLEGMPEAPAAAAQQGSTGAAAPVLNRAGTQAPAGKGQGNTEADRAEKIRNRAMAIQQNSPGMKWDLCWKQATDENSRQS